MVSNKLKNMQISTVFSYANPQVAASECPTDATTTKLPTDATATEWPTDATATELATE